MLVPVRYPVINGSKASRTRSRFTPIELHPLLWRTTVLPAALACAHEAAAIPTELLRYGQFGTGGGTVFSSNLIANAQVAAVSLDYVISGPMIGEALTRSQSG
jgi:hypothetical protein